MPIRIRGQKDFSIGVIYLALGVAGFILAQGYSFGTPARMGAGFFPTIISALLVLFGLIATLRGVIVPSPGLGKVDWKGIALITGSVCAFGLLLERVGLPIAIVVSALLAATASDRFRPDWRAAVGLLGLALFCSLVFVWGLGVPMPLIGEFFTDYGF